VTALVSTVLVAPAVFSAGCRSTGPSSAPGDTLHASDGAVAAPPDAALDAYSGADAIVEAPPDPALDAQSGADATIEAAPDPRLDAETAADAGAAVAYPSAACSSATPPPAGTPKCAQLGLSCAPSGLFGFGSGSLLICDSGTWRYALRSDVPDGTYGGFTSRPSWYPPLRAFNNTPAAAPCKLSLAYAPIDPSQITTITPSGAMLGDHVTPIDHFYMSVTGTAANPTPIYATADGTVLLVSSLGGPNTIQVVLAHACETLSVYGVINQLAGVLAPYQSIVAAGGRANPQLSIKAGDIIGQQWLDPMEIAIQDGAVWLPGFAHPFPYVSESGWAPYTADPLAYLPQPAASQYQAKMQRAVRPYAGKTDWDTVGTAAGSWFLKGTLGYSGNLTSTYIHATTPVPGGQVPGKRHYSWSHLALAPHWVQPSVWLASMGTWVDPTGDGVQFAIQPGPVRPDQLTIGQTAVYELAHWNSTAADGGAIDYAIPPVGYLVTPVTANIGVLAVRVNGDNTLTVEKRPDLTSASSFTGFTSLAETYWR
jgi:hypothetical protein